MKLIPLVFLLIPIKFISQNLVKNPSFEKTEKCADTVSLFNKNVNNWSTPTLGTTDLFSTCSSNINSIPNNFNGYQVSQFGEHYAGCYFYTENDYREYIQGSFISPLEKDKKYNVSFYISLAENSEFALNTIDFMLTKNMILTSTETELSQNLIKNLITDSYSLNTILNKKNYHDKDNWVLISKEITAKGGENFITIGNFKKNSLTKKKRVSKSSKTNMSYYYIDMVSVEPVDKLNPDLTKPTQIVEQKDSIKIVNPNKFELNKKYTFKNINFDTNSFELSQLAKNEIQTLFEYLKLNTNTKIYISGHTDNLGSDNYNKVLSESRVKSVAEYLIKLGIIEARIETFGYGNTQPISSNKTEEGRKKNRRVEFKIFKTKP